MLVPFSPAKHTSKLFGGNQLLKQLRLGKEKGLLAGDGGSSVNCLALLRQLDLSNRIPLLQAIIYINELFQRKYFSFPHF